MNALISSWTTQVAKNFNLDVTTLQNIYTSADTHDSEMRTRYMYKYNAHHRISGTPYAFVNGILLENFPTNSTVWMEMLQSVYDSQYKPTSVQSDL